MKSSLLGLSGVLLFLCLAGQAQTSVVTQHNNASRTGWDSTESILNHYNVNIQDFGKLFTRAVDDRIYAQPLVVSNLYMPALGASANVVFVATVNNTVYAFDADNPASSSPIWSTNLTPSGDRPPNNLDAFPGLCGGSYTDFLGNYGIVGTPVIDTVAKLLYVIAKYCNGALVDDHPYNNDETSYSSTGFYQSIFAINIQTGAVITSQPIAASAPGTGDGSSGGNVSLDPRRNFNRPGLVLSQGIVYAGFSAHCDWNYYHGWILGFDATTLALRMAWTPTPNDARGGIWMSGGAPAVDGSGNLFFASGNGASSNPADPKQRGESVIKLTPNLVTNTLSLATYFTPYNYKSLDDNDQDFDVQVLLIPNSTWAFTGGKDGNLYFMNQASLGGFNTSSNNVLYTYNLNNANASSHSNLAYYRNAQNEFIYQNSENTPVTAFPINRSGPSFGTPITNTTNEPTGEIGGFMAVSSKGSSDTTSGILWLLQPQTGCSAAANDCPGVLRAFNANNIATELWNSDMNLGDTVGNFTKLSSVTIANGKVYVPTISNVLSVFGPKDSSCFAAPHTNLALHAPIVESSQESGSYPATNAVDGNLTTRWSSAFKDSQWIYVDLGAQFTLCGVIINWENSYGVNFNIDVSNDATNWTTVKAVTNNNALNTVLTLSGIGRYVRMFGLTRHVINGNQYGFSIFEFKVYGTPYNPLPILLKDFTATNVRDEYVALKWTTETELNNDHFEVQRSADASHFSTILQVRGSGSTEVPHTYTANDSTPIRGWNYYRLKQVDRDGKFTYSPVVRVNVGHAGAPLLYPNPVTSYFTVDAGEDPIQQIRVLDATGKEVTRMANTGGKNQIQVNCAAFPAGIYFVEVTTARQQFELKMVKP